MYTNKKTQKLIEKNRLKLKYNDGLSKVQKI